MIWETAGPSRTYGFRSVHTIGNVTRSCSSTGPEGGITLCAGDWRQRASELVLALSCVLLLTACSMAVAPASPRLPSSPSSIQPSQVSGTIENLQTCLLGRWTHSQEEDTPGIAIYRRRQYEFPLARGRTGFDFIASGEAVTYDIADSDGVNELFGRWETQGSDGIKITFDDDRIEPVVLYVLTCDADKIAMRN